MYSALSRVDFITERERASAAAAARFFLPHSLTRSFTGVLWPTCRKVAAAAVGVGEAAAAAASALASVNVVVVLDSILAKRGNWDARRMGAVFFREG